MSPRQRNRRHRRAPLLVRRRHTPDAAPGTLAPHADAGPSALTVMAYGAEGLKEAQGAAALDLIASASEAATWIDIVGLADAPLFRRLGERFGLHPLALEDTLNVHQRPKAEDYDEVTYLVLRMPGAEPALPFEQVSLFIGRRFVITVRERAGDGFDAVRQRLRSMKGRLPRAGPDYLAYSLVDAIVDRYFPIVERYGDALETLEESIVRPDGVEAVNEVFAIRRELHRLRRVLWRTREAVTMLATTDLEPVGTETRVFFRDAQDHVIQLVDDVEACYELSAGLLDLHLSTLTYRMNDVMRLLTIIATIFIPLTFIAGVYGMNFDPTRSPWNMPELGWYFGYPFALGLMAVTAAALGAYFWRRGWFRGS